MLFNLKTLLWILVGLFLLAGCATQLGKNQAGTLSTNNKESQQVAHYIHQQYQLARQYQEEAHFADAITTYENILAIDPNYAEAHNGIGVIYAIQGKYEPALRHLQKAVALAPLASHLHNNLGYAYLLQGQETEAISAFEQALRLDPDNLNARANLAAMRNKTKTEIDITGE